MIYTVNHEESSESEFNRALRRVTSEYAIDNSYFTECGSFQVTEYEDGSMYESGDNSKEIVIG